MSHFTVGVIVENPNDLGRALAPYDEQNEEFFERVLWHTKDTYIAQNRSCYPDKTDEEIWAQAIEDYDIENDKVYLHFNPNGQWDWYSIGGRWRYSLKKYKSGPQIVDQDLFCTEPRHQKGKYRWVDGARIKDILWSHMNKASKKDIEKYSRFWDVAVNNAPLQEGENIQICYSPEYYREKYGTKENFIMKQTIFYTHNLLDDISGEWYSCGDTGWFDLDNATRDSLDIYLEKFYSIVRNPAYRDYWFIVVDCHV